MGAFTWLAILAGWYKGATPPETKAPLSETPKACDGENPAPGETKPANGETAVVWRPVNIPMPCVIRRIGERTTDLMSLN